MLTIDGSKGEGGGQILRTALTSSLLTGRPFRIERIRASRRRPGLLHQHLTAVRAAAEIARAETEGARYGSDSLTFQPDKVRPGSYRFAIGTAGSTGLVLQTVLVPLLTADGESELIIEGGTHNEGAPSFEFLDLTLAPLLRRMGADLSLSLDRPGFYPAGGGRIRALIGPTAWNRLDLPDRGAIRSVWARGVVSRLPISIAERELNLVGRELGLDEENLVAVRVDADGPGNVLILAVESEHITGVFTGFGRRGLRAEEVARGVTEEVQHYLDSGVAVGTHLANQLQLPFTQSGGGSFLTLQPTAHFKTNLDVLSNFFELEITANPVGRNVMLEFKVN